MTRYASVLRIPPENLPFRAGRRRPGTDETADEGLDIAVREVVRYLRW